MPSGDHHSGDRGYEHEHRVEPPCPSVTESDRQGPLSHLRVARKVAEIVHHEERAGQRTNSAPGDHADGRDLSDRHEGGADGRDEPEEHEHEHLTQSEVAVGGGSTGVAPAGGDADHPDSDQPPGDHRREHKTGHAGDPERHQSGVADPMSRNPASDEPQWTNAIVIGASDTVAVVVRVVHGDLQREAHDQGERDRDEGHVVAIRHRPRGCCPDGHWYNGGRQRARPGAEHPESPTARQGFFGRRRRCGAAHWRP